MKLRVKTAIWVIGAVWLIAMLALIPRFVSVHRDTQKVEETFADYGSALVNHRFEDAYRLCDSSFRNATPYDKFVDINENLESQYGRLESVNRQGLEVRCGGDTFACTAIINSELIFQNKTLKYKFVLHKEDGRWTLFGGEEL
jgi:hypothetical protein